MTEPTRPDHTAPDAPASAQAQPAQSAQPGPPPTPAATSTDVPPQASTGAGQGAGAGSKTVSHLNLIVVPALCLAALAFMYTRLDTRIEALRESQRQLAAEIASMRRTPLIDIAGAPARGSADALVTLIEYSDYECPFCIRYANDTRPRIEEEYVQTGRLRYVFRDFPVDELHPAAIRAHEASRCALEQGRFWELHVTLFSPPGTHGDDQLRERARDAGLDMSRFEACFASGRTVADIRRTASEAASMGASGTPAFFLGLYDPATGQVRILRGITGAQPYEVFQQTIDLLLQQAQ